MVTSSDDDGAEDDDDDGGGCGCDCDDANDGAEDDDDGRGCDEDDSGSCGCDEDDVDDMVKNDETIVASVSARSIQQSRLLGKITSASTTKSNNRDCRSDVCWSCSTRVS